MLLLVFLLSVLCYANTEIFKLERVYSKLLHQKPNFNNKIKDVDDRRDDAIKASEFIIK